MKVLIKSIFKQNFFRSSLLLVSTGIFGGILGYIFQILMGRYLSVSDYAIFIALMAKLYVFAAPLSTINLLLTRKISSFKVDNEFNKIAYLFSTCNLYSLLIISFFFFAAFLFKDSLINFLKINSLTELIIILFIVFVSVFQSLSNSILQGFMSFKFYAFIGIVTVLLKIFLALLAVNLGYGLIGVLFSVFLASFFGYLISLKQNLRLLPPLIQKQKFNFNSIFSSSWQVFLANIMFVYFSQIDILVVDYFFNNTDKSVFFVAAIIGKAAMYLPAGISTAIFPMTAEKNSKRESKFNIFLQGLTLTAFLGFASAIFFYFLSEEIIMFFYGIEYQESINILKFYGIAMIPISLIHVIEHFLIATGKVLFVYLLLLIAPLQLVLISHYHSSFLEILIAVYSSLSIVAIVGIIMVFINLSKKNEYKKSNI